MRCTWSVAAILLAAGVAFSGGAGIDKRQSESQPTPPSRFSRETPTVLAVRKTRDSIVTLKVQKRTSRKETVGTGVIIDERGYIVTNRHVISAHQTIKVVLADNTSFEGEVDFEEPSYDLAIIKIRTERKLKPLALGPASDLMVGEPVIAIGHPYGYVNTVSTGIISAVDREIEMPNGLVLKDLIQVTAAINPGNSGGPLLNVNGELIGINVALRQDAQGIAFALNADTVQQVLSRRLSASRKLGLYHGIDCRESVQPDGDVRTRVVVHDVAENTPAASAGLKEGDEIVRLGDYRICNRFDVERALWDVRTGETVQLRVVRGGREVVVPLKLSRDERTASRGQ
jgi:serine protease Do